MNEQVTETKRLYEGSIINLRLDSVTLEDGLQATREVVEHDPCVVILPVDISSKTVHLIHQYRRATKQVLIEAPAGIVDPGEDFLKAAHRELREETGFIAEQMIPLCEAYPAPGFCEEYMYFYLALGLTSGEQDLDHDERIEVVSYTFDALDDLIDSNRIIDAKTLLIYLMARRHLNRL